MMSKNTILATLFSLFISFSFAQLSADFTSDTQENCTSPLPYTVQFQDISSGSISSYLWDFGNGQTSTLANPSTVYNSVGNYVVSLIISDGVSSDTITKFNYIRIIDPPISADFTLSGTSGCVPLTINFNNTNANAQNYIWDFGDGNFTLGQNVSHTYVDSGTFEATLVAVSGSCNDTSSQTIVVGETPTVDFQLNSDSVSCDGSLFASFLSLYSPDVNSWLWDFGTSVTSTAPVATAFSYNTPGEYTVSLTVSNAAGCSATEVKPNFIRVENLAADFVVNTQSACAPGNIQFTDQSLASDSIIAWEWDFGDGNTSSQQSPAHSYANSGSYDVSLIVHSSLGCSDTMIRAAFITIFEPAPNLNFIAIPSFSCAIDPVVFFNLSSPSSGNTFTWDFGDGTSLQGLNASHFFQDTGFFDITLIGTTADGCSDTLVQPNGVEIIEPVALFTPSDMIACSVPALISFQDSSIEAQAWEWDFGDGNTSTLQNPTHTYTTAGNYTVVLRVVNNSTGCEDVTEEVISIGNPTANFSASNPIGCGDYTVDFINSSPNTESYFWDFGDGNSSANPTPSNTYTAAGVYDVSLVATDTLGCSDTLLRSNYVTIGDLQADFTVNQQSACAPFTPQFQDVASLAPASNQITAWFWDFGDGTTSTDSTPTHNYTIPNQYDVSLILQTNLGCIDTITQIDFISANGVSVQFGADETADCAPFIVNFSDSSSVFGGSINTWNWDFGDGGSSAQQNPLYIYNTPGLYDVSLLVVDDNGCRDSIVRSDYIDVCTPLTSAFDCDSLANCSVGNLGDVDLAGIDSGEVLVWNGMQFVGDSIASGGSSVWDLNGNDAFYVDGLVGIGSSNPAAVLDVSGSNLDTLPALRLAASDNNAPNGYTFEIKGHPTGTNNASNHVQLSTGESASRMTIKAAEDADRAPRLQMTGAAETNNPGWAIFDYGSQLIDLPDASFKMRYMSVSNSAVDMIQAQADTAVLIVPQKGQVGIGTQNPQALLDVAGQIRSDVLVGGGNVVADANGNLVIGTDEIDDADADPSNELLQNASLSGSLLELTDAGGTFSVDLSSLAGSGGNTGNDNDWSFVSGNNLTDPIYRTGNVGIGNTNPQAQLHITNGSVLFDGSVGATPVSGAGSRMMWVPEKGAFRSGTVFGTQWDDANIGQYSVAMGISTTASGLSSVAMGQETEASARGAVAMGRETEASAEGATAFGRNNVASAQGASVMGFNNEASGFGATAMGVSTVASGDYAFAMGSLSLANGFNSIAAGVSTEAFGSYSTALGESNQASYASLAIGRNNLDSSSATVWVGTDYAFTIGDGLDNSTNRSNCLYVQKNGDMWIQGTLTQFSDRRLKENVQDLGDVWPKLEQLNGVSYDWKDANMSDKRQLGLIAQELEAVYPELVTEVEGYKAVNYIGLIPVLLEGMKQQQDFIEQQQGMIEGMREELSDVKELLEDAGLHKPSVQGAKPAHAPSIPTQSQLFQNQPNPFHTQTEIPYFLAEPLQAEIWVFEMQSGKVIEQFSIQGEGFGSVQFNSQKLPAGVYAYQLRCRGEALDVRRMVLVD